MVSILEIDIGDRAGGDRCIVDDVGLGLAAEALALQRDLTVGGAEARDTLKRAIAMGADGAVHVNDPSLADADSATTAAVLAAAIQKIGEFDLILSGRQASDTDAGQVPLGVAEMLGLPSIAPVVSIEPSGDGLKVHRMVEDGHQVVEVGLFEQLARFLEMQ